MRKYRYDYTEHYFVTDLGYARNFGPNHSLGGTVFFGGPGTRGEQLGVRLRLVTWLGPNVSLDIAPGIILWEDEPSYVRFKSPGFSSQACLNLGGQFGFVAQVSSVDRRARYYGYYPSYPPYEYNIHETAWHLGIRLGGEMGIAGSAAFGLAEATAQGRIYSRTYP
jgi:hypothetical protein